MEDKASETGKRAQSGPRREVPAWLRPLLRVWPAIGGRPNEEDEEEKGDPGIRLTYDLKDTLTDNRFVGLWRMATGFRKIYILAVFAAGLAALSRSAVFYLLRYFVDDVLANADLSVANTVGGGRGYRSDAAARAVLVWDGPAGSANG